jgi:hypothetical protein
VGRLKRLINPEKGKGRLNRRPFSNEGEENSVVLPKCLLRIPRASERLS